MKAFYQFLSALIGRVQQLETNRPKTNDKNKDDKDEDEGILDDDFVYRDNGMIDERVTRERNPQRCLQSNRTGMGGNVNNEHNCGIVCNNDPYAKIKFTIPPFYGKYDVKEYLDWEITEQNLLPTLFLIITSLDKLLVSLKKLCYNLVTRISYFASTT